MRFPLIPPDTESELRTAIEATKLGARRQAPWMQGDAGPGPLPAPSKADRPLGDADVPARPKSLARRMHGGEHDPSMARGLAHHAEERQ